jgi:Trk-type K+ transport system membrane component
MSFEKQIAKAFNLEGDSWMKHANPWSIWTRFATLPFLVLAVWSRVWLGWYCLIPIILIVLWIKFNPTLFRKPKSFDNWGSKSVLGERYWAERKTKPVPNHHKTPILILTILQTLGGITLILGLWKLDLSLTIIGSITVYFAKMWFLDRMVWVFEDMQGK